MRILHLDTGLSLRGGQQQVLFLMQGLRSRGCEQVLVSSPGSPLSSTAQDRGFEVYDIDTRGWGSLSALWKLRSLFRERKPEILHFHDARAHGFGQLANRKFGFPVIVSRRVAFPGQMGYFSRRKYFSPGQRYIAVSLFVKKVMLESGLRSELIDVVYDGVDSHAPTGTSRREQFGIEQEEFAIGTVGALTPEKGQLLLVKAMVQLSRAIPEARCIIAGSGSESGRLNREIRSHLLEAKVKIIPPPELLQDFLRSLDLFVLPSRFEGLGSILLLAFHCGTPVLASDAGGIPELVENGVDGFLFSEGDISALRRSVETLAKDSTLRQSVVAHAQQKSRTRFSIEAVTEATLQSYHRTINQHSI
jgi:L-malate glycosyltransferase